MAKYVSCIIYVAYSDLAVVNKIEMHHVFNVCIGKIVEHGLELVGAIVISFLESPLLACVVLA